MPVSCSQYFCPTNGPCIKRPIQAEGLAPWVRMSFPAMNIAGPTSAGGQNFAATVNPAPKPDLTVGNQSNSPNNHAIIKSFQYGASDGNGAEVEIMDEEGGEFDLLVNKMVKVLNDGNEYGCSIEWGWAVANCNGTTSVIQSSKHYFLILAIDINFSEKGLIFKLELQDLMEPLFETRQQDIFEDVTLKEAIIRLFRDKATPRVDSVLFKKFTPQASGQIPCNNLVEGNGLGNQTMNINPAAMQDFIFKGPLETETANWECKNLNPLACIREWLKDKMTEDDRGTIIFWNSVSSVPQLIILEDPLPKCWSDLDSEQCSRSLGTYIVGGGKDSPVMSFDPHIKFNFAAAAKAGAVVDTETAQGGEQRPANPCPENSGGPDGGAIPVGSGDTTFIQMNEPFNRIYGPGNIILALRGVAANEKANKTYENIEAELKIQGDPTLDNPFTIKVKTLSLIVINPFHLRTASGNQVLSGSFGNCPEWLVGPPCNQILSNRNWFIKGVAHEIKDGSFTTTLKLYLPAPGQTIIAP